MNPLCLGMTCYLAAAATYWVFPRRAPRPAGTWAMGALMAAFALNFLTTAPLAERPLETTAPFAAELLRNSSSLAAATAILTVSIQLNLEPADARRRIRSHVLPLTTAAFALIVLFTYVHHLHRSPQVFTTEAVLFITYLGTATTKLAHQTLSQSKTAHRTSLRTGLRLTALGCAIWPLYAAHTLKTLFTPGLAPDTPSVHTVPGALFLFSVASPALAVLLISLGLTAPAAVYPIAQARRRRWEVRSFEKLAPLWQDLTTAIPDIVLPTAGPEDESPAEPAFLLQRRVIEISDGILTLRPYRSRTVLETAQQMTDPRAEDRAAVIEATAVKAALASMKAGRLAEEVAPATADSASRTDLRTDTQWLLHVANAYAHRTTPAVGNDRTEPVGA